MHRRRFVGRALMAGALAPLPIQDLAAPEIPLGARGDGIADDTAALQRAADGGLLRLGAGSYRITKPIVITLAERGPAAVSGDGRARIIMDGPGPALHLIGTHDRTARPADFRSEVWERERLPLVSGLEIRGAHPEAEGIRLEGTMQATLSGLLIRRCRIGIHLARRNRNLLVTHCHVHDNTETGILFDRVNMHQAIIASSHVSYNAAVGIHLLGGELRNFQIAGNDIEYNHDERREGCADILIDVREDGATFREGTIAGNTIQARASPGGANVRILGGGGLRTGGLLTVSGNLIGSQTTNVHLADCRGVVIAGNSLYSGFERTLLIERSANISVGANTIDWNPDARTKGAVDGIAIRDSEGVTLTGLTLEGCFQGSAVAGGTIEIERSREVLISGCQVLDSRHRGIVLRDALRCRVSSSTVLDRRVEPSSRASIQVLGDSKDNAVSGNTVNPGGLVVAAGGAIVEGNIEVGPKLP